MSCCVIATLPPIARQQGAPRITVPHVPIDSNAGEPNNIPHQTAIVKESLEKEIPVSVMLTGISL